jgi:hypothetical protein
MVLEAEHGNIILCITDYQITGDHVEVQIQSFSQTAYETDDK